MSKIREYEGDRLTIRFDARRCIHAEECIHGLPGVFEKDRRPWIDPNAGDVEAAVEVVQRCPTGALTYRRAGDGPVESAPEAVTVRVVADGPVYAHGELRSTAENGTDELRAAYCRCGHSKNKPYCDNSHLEAGFADDGTLGTTGATAEPAPTPVDVTPLANGPLMVKGNFKIEGANGEMWVSKAALCRCGASANKPFCDGAHKRINFEAP